jgi:hypothetical protein
MQLLYEGENEYETLSADEWGIKSDDPAVALSADGASVYQATYNVKNYTEKTSVTLSTTYSDENGDEQVGPTLILDFPVVEIKPVGLVDLKQTAFPIAKGKDGQLEFKVTGLKDPSIYVVDADSSEISATASDCTVSVSVPSGAGNALTLTVGAKTQSGTKVRDITYTVSMKPGNTNVYNTAGSQKLGIFIPYVTAIKNYNSSLSAPAEGQSVVLYTADGKEIKYQNVPGSTYGSITYQYKATYDGKTYFYYAQGQQWRLLP